MQRFCNYFRLALLFQLNLWRIAINSNNLNFQIEIIQLHEYKAEVYRVQTDDEYILELHRITGPKNNPNPKGKPVAYLQHGIMSSSADWVLGGPGKGLGKLKFEIFYGHILSYEDVY